MVNHAGSSVADLFDLDSCEVGDDDDMMFQLLSQFESKFPAAGSGGIHSALNSSAQAVAPIPPTLQYSMGAPATQRHAAATGQIQYSLPGSPHCQPGRAPLTSNQQTVFPGEEVARIRRQLSSLQQEKRALMMEKLSKEGEVKIVRNRLNQIEDENKQLRNQINQVSHHQQQEICDLKSKYQREIELMKTQLMFQSQELLEAKQNRSGKLLRPAVVQSEAPVGNPSNEAAKSLRHGNGFETAAVATPVNKIDKDMQSSNEEAECAQQKTADQANELIRLLGVIDNAELKSHLIKSFGLAQKCRADETLPAALESALIYSVNESKMETASELIRFIFGLYFHSGNCARKQRFKSCFLTIVNATIDKKQIALCCSLLDSLLDRPTHSDVMDAMINQQTVDAIVDQALSENTITRVLALKVLAKLARLNEFRELYLKLSDVSRSALSKLIDWTATKDRGQQWLLYFYASLVFHHHDSDRIVEMLLKIVFPRLILCLLTTFDDVHKDIFDQSDESTNRSKLLSLLVRLIYVIQKAAVRSPALKSILSESSIEILPDVNLTVLPALYGTLERLVEIKLIYSDLLFDDELFLAGVILQNRLFN